MAQVYILAMKILHKGAHNVCVCVSQSEFWFLLFVNATHLIGSSGFLKAFDRNIKYGGHLESKERFAI